jgi:hypothetical protein
MVFQVLGETMRAMPEQSGRNTAGGRPRALIWLALAAAGIAAVAGCSSGTVGSSKGAGGETNPWQLYFSPQMTNNAQATYAIDDSENTFVRSTYSPSGQTITDSGTFSSLSGQIVALGVTYISDLDNSYTVASDSSPIAGSYAVEISGQAALIAVNTPQLAGTPETIPAISYFSPAVPTASCPNLASAQTFNFVTIPKTLAPATATTLSSSSWNPQLETAFGTVQVSTSGTSVQFGKISQYTLPAGGASAGAPSVTPPSSAASVCAQTDYGNLISVPLTSTITSPGQNETASWSAVVGIGPSGFLVEDADVLPSGTTATPTPNGTPYNNLLGAGYGAIGLPQPGSDITADAVSAQYQGFFFSPASFALMGYFGVSDPAASCSTLTAQMAAAKLTPSANTIYGGEYPLSGSGSSALGTPSCDFAIDLGQPGQSGGNGIYSNATLYVGGAFPENGSGGLYTFPAAAIAGQLSGKNAILVIGADTAGSPHRSWGIYLLPSG